MINCIFLKVFTSPDTAEESFRYPQNASQRPGEAVDIPEIPPISWRKGKKTPHLEWNDFIGFLLLGISIIFANKNAASLEGSQ